MMTLLIYVALWLFWSLVAMLFVPLIWFMFCVPLILFVPEDACTDGTRFSLGGMAFLVMLVSAPAVGMLLSLVSL